MTNTERKTPSRSRAKPTADRGSHATDVDGGSGDFVHVLDAALRGLSDVGLDCSHLAIQSRPAKAVAANADGLDHQREQVVPVVISGSRSATVHALKICESRKLATQDGVPDAVDGASAFLVARAGTLMAKQSRSFLPIRGASATEAEAHLDLLRFASHGPLLTLEIHAKAISHDRSEVRTLAVCDLSQCVEGDWPLVIWLGGSGCNFGPSRRPRVFELSLEVLDD